MDESTARRWLKKKPGSRPREFYDRERDRIITVAHIPTLDGKDVHLTGTPEEYPTARDAVAAAKAFQAAIRSNHPPLCIKHT